MSTVGEGAKEVPGPGGPRVRASPPPFASVLFLATCPMGPWLSCCWPHTTRWGLKVRSLGGRAGRVWRLVAGTS